MVYIMIDKEPSGTVLVSTQTFVSNDSDVAQVQSQSNKESTVG